MTGDHNVQAQKVKDSNQIIIKTQTLNLDEREALNNALADKFGVDTSTITAENISSTVSSEMRQDAIIAVIISAICMLIYIWFRFKDVRFASSAVLALYTICYLCLHSMHLQEHLSVIHLSHVC